MKTYAELNRENQELAQKLKDTQVMLEAQRENNRVLVNRAKKVVKYLLEPNRDKFDCSKAFIIETLEPGVKY